MNNTVLFMCRRKKECLDRHKKLGLGFGVCAQVSDFFTVSLTDCSWGVCGIHVKLPQLGPLAVVVLRIVEM